MKKQKIVSGTIVGIKLNHNLGYIFAKIVDLTEYSEIDLSKTFHFVIYPYNYIEQKISNFDINLFTDAKPLTGSLFVMDIEAAIKKGIWQNMGISLLSNYEKNVPAFRNFNSTILAVHKYEKDANSWRYFEKGTPYQWITAEYSSIKHLENSTCLSHDLIEKRLSMEILHRNGKKIEDFYKLEKWEDLCVYYNMLYTTPFNEIQDDIKGKVVK